MKRYEPCYNGNGDPAMAESPNGKYYSRADLIAAGVLVPVPDGEAELVLDVPHGSLFESDEKIYEKSGDAWGDSGPEYCCVKQIAGSVRGQASPSLRVQPVRLVPLEDVG